VTSPLPARDLVDVRLAAAMEAGGCPICGVRSRAERGTLDAILAERVNDLGFRAGVERDHAFCRRHAAEILVADRRHSGMLGSSILYAAILGRRVEALREAIAAGGRSRRRRLAALTKRPPCPVCDQGATSVATAFARLTARLGDPEWMEAAATAEFCMDDLIELAATADDAPTFAPVAARQLARFDDLRSRLEGYADHSAEDRRHLLIDDEARAADEAARALGGTDRTV
jgi:Family of unknown function (DUF6062)